jgi:hypothetical protein
VFQNVAKRCKTLQNVAGVTTGANLKFFPSNDGTKRAFLFALYKVNQNNVRKTEQYSQNRTMFAKQNNVRKTEQCSQSRTMFAKQNNVRKAKQC